MVQVPRWSKIEWIPWSCLHTVQKIPQQASWCLLHREYLEVCSKLLQSQAAAGKIVFPAQEVIPGDNGPNQPLICTPSRLTDSRIQVEFRVIVKFRTGAGHTTGMTLVQPWAEFGWPLNDDDSDARGQWQGQPELSVNLPVSWNAADWAWAGWASSSKHCVFISWYVPGGYSSSSTRSSNPQSSCALRWCCGIPWCPTCLKEFLRHRQHPT